VRYSFCIQLSMCLISESAKGIMAGLGDEIAKISRTAMLRWIGRRIILSGNHDSLAYKKFQNLLEADK
jgi:hypothetical protein